MCIVLRRFFILINLTADGREAMLTVPVSQHDGQYVNAVNVRSSNLQNAYIVTEHPMSHTMGRTWKLAFTRFASAWVLLHDHTNLSDRKVVIRYVI